MMPCAVPKLPKLDCCAAILQNSRTIKPMRILHVVQSLDPAAGGPPLVAQKLAAAQRELSQDAQVISYESFKGFGPFEELIASVEIVHLHGLWDQLVRIAAHLAYASSIPYVIAPHGMLHPWSLRQKWLKKRIALWFFGYWSVVNRAAFIHVLNEEEQKILSPLRLRPPYEVIANGIDPREFDSLPAPQEFHSRHPELSGRRFVLFLSRLHYKKGLDFLADAFAILGARNKE